MRVCIHGYRGVPICVWSIYLMLNVCLHACGVCAFIRECMCVCVFVCVSQLSDELSEGFFQCHLTRLHFPHQLLICKQYGDSLCSTMGTLKVALSEFLN